MVVLPEMGVTSRLVVVTLVGGRGVEHGHVGRVVRRDGVVVAAE